MEELECYIGLGLENSVYLVVWRGLGYWYLDKNWGI